MRGSRNTFKRQLFQANVPIIPVISPEKSMEHTSNKNLKFSVLPMKDGVKHPLSKSPKRKSADVVLAKNLSPFSITFDDIEDENDGVYISTSNRNLIANSRSSIVTASAKSDNSSTDYSDQNILLYSKSETVKVRKRAQVYSKRRGSLLFSEYSPIEIPVELEKSSSNDNSLSNADESYIRKVIKIQSLVRKFIVYKRIMNEESKRLVDRNKIEEDAFDIYNNEYNRIDSLVKSGKSCKEFDEAVDILDQYAEDIANNGISNKEEEEKLKYLFYMCSEDDTSTLFLHEFLVLTNDLLKFSTPYFSYVMMFPEASIKIQFTSFLQWFKSCKNKGVKRRGLIKRKLSNCFSKQVTYPYLYNFFNNLYRKYIKCNLLNIHVKNKLNEYDKLHVPQFQCPICHITNLIPKYLAKHIVQCKYDNNIKRFSL